MDEKTNATVVTETIPTLPVLIIDKAGSLGTLLAESLQQQLLLVLASAIPPEHAERLIYIPFKRKVLKLPDNTYSHLFVFYNGESEVLDLLPSLIQKAHDTHAKVLFITSLHLSTEKLYKKLQQYAHPALQVVFYGEIFDGSLADKTELSFMVRQIKQSGRIELPNEGLGMLYPVHLEDVLLGIVTVAFQAERNFKTFYLFPHQPFSQFTIARMFQRIDPDIRIDYKKKRYHAPQYYIPHGIPMLTNYRLEDRLREFDLTYKKHRTLEIPEQKISLDETPKQQIKLVQHNPYANKERIQFGFILFFAVFIAPLIATLLIALGGVSFLGQSVKHIERAEFTQAQQSAQLAQAAFVASDALSQSLILPSLFLPQQKNQFVTMVQTGTEVAGAEVALLDSIQHLQNIYDGKSLDPKNDFLQTLATLKNTLLTVQKLKAEGKLPEPVVKKLEQHTRTLNLLEGTIDTWPALFGFEGKKKYLILFQNNMELRPGGGFIGSYGILEMENGQMKGLKIHDVYDADGQLKTHIEPPYGLRRYLGASHWFLRDSNFALDFRENALQATQFLNLETGESVDGIIAVDTNFMQSLLRVVGSVKVPEYNETVTPENFYLLTQTHAEENFFPGSTKKKDFLRSLSNALLTELFEKRNYSYEKLLFEVEQSVREKHLLAAFSDNGVQNTFTVNGLSSALYDNRSTEGNSYADFLSIVDANVGTNKSNYYLKRLIRHNVTIQTSGALQADVEAVYKNISDSKSAFGGDYKSFVRFVIPSTAQVQSIAFDNVTQQILPAVTDPVIYKQEGYVPPSGLEVQETFTQGKKVVGFFVGVPMGATKTVRLSYTTPRTIKTEETVFTYQHRFFKQPGAIEDPYQLTVTYPKDFSLIKASGGVSDLGGKFIYEKTLKEDTDITATFSKK